MFMLTGCKNTYTPSARHRRSCKPLSWYWYTPSHRPFAIDSRHATYINIRVYLKYIYLVPRRIRPVAIGSPRIFILATRRTGLDHLLYTVRGGATGSDEEPTQLRVACFMGLVSFLSSRVEVLRVSPRHTTRPLNAVARTIIQSATLTEAPLTAAGLDGTGQIIQVRFRERTLAYLGPGVRRQQSVHQRSEWIGRAPTTTHRCDTKTAGFVVNISVSRTNM